MYKKLIPPVLTLAVLSGFILTSTPVIAADSPPVSSESISQVFTVSSAPVRADAEVKLNFEKAKVSTIAAPPPVKVEKEEAKSEPKVENTVEESAPDSKQQDATEDITTSGNTEIERMQLGAQNAYIASAAKDPVVSNPSKAAVSSDEIVSIAKSKAGVAYVWGGTSHVSGWDCSGYVQWVFAQAGVKLPRVSQWVGQEKISEKDALPGDLVVQNNGTHVGIYLGNGRMISALNPSVGTMEHSTDILPSDFYRIVK